MFERTSPPSFYAIRQLRAGTRPPAPTPMPLAITLEQTTAPFLEEIPQPTPEALQPAPLADRPPIHTMTPSTTQTPATIISEQSPPLSREGTLPPAAAGETLRPIAARRNPSISVLANSPSYFPPSNATGARMNACSPITGWNAWSCVSDSLRLLPLISQRNSWLGHKPPQTKGVNGAALSLCFHHKAVYAIRISLLFIANLGFCISVGVDALLFLLTRDCCHFCLTSFCSVLSPLLPRFGPSAHCRYTHSDTSAGHNLSRCRSFTSSFVR